MSAAANDTIRNALTAAEAADHMRHADVAPGMSRDIEGDMIIPGEWTPGPLGLPPDCPVQPLGMDGDGKAYFLTPRGTVSVLTGSSSGKGHIEAMFAGRIHYLFWAFPAYTKNGKINPKRWDAEAARRCLFDAASYKGEFDSTDMIRGRGASLNEYNQLVYHAGDKVFVKTVDQHFPPGEIGKYLYTKRVRGPHPWADRVRSGDDLYSDLNFVIERLLSWKWQRPGLDPYLLFGWVACALFGGALGWRPHVIITGQHSSGKSTLNHFMQMIMDTGLIQTANTTAAGIYQSLRHDTLAVLFDEAEASEDDGSLQKVIGLSRISSSGGKTLRGGAEHRHVEFTLRSCFCFAAINPPSLKDQDRSRMAIFRLGSFTSEDEEPEFDGPRLRDAGRRIIRRVIDHWDLFGRTCEAVFTGLRQGCGVNQRVAKQYGTMMAMYHVLFHDDDITDRQIKDWVAKFKPVVDTELTQHLSNWESCLEHLLDTSIANWTNRSHRSVRALLFDFFQDGAESDGPSLATVRKQLHEIGCTLLDAGAVNVKTARKEAFLFIPAAHPTLADQVFRHSQWRTRPGTEGVWNGAIKQAPDTVVQTRARARVAGRVTAGVKVKVSTILNYSADGGSYDTA